MPPQRFGQRSASRQTLRHRVRQTAIGIGAQRGQRRRIQVFRQAPIEAEPEAASDEASEPAEESGDSDEEDADEDESEDSDDEDEDE